jgi:hypothetical protein
MLLSLSLVTLGCQNYSDQLQRAQSYYERNQYEMALAVVRNLEADQDSLSDSEAVRYCYVRGMTDYRLGDEVNARYWLGLSVAAAKDNPQALSADEKARVAETLAELNAAVFGKPSAASQQDTSQASASRGGS